jgi:hypothetical protein
MRKAKTSQAGGRPSLSAHRIESRHSKLSRFVIAAQESEDPEVVAKKERLLAIKRLLGSPGATDRDDFDELIKKHDELEEEVGDKKRG